jgi:hypothetical protein
MGLTEADNAMLWFVSKENEYKGKADAACDDCKSFGKHFNIGSAKRCELPCLQLRKHFIKQSVQASLKFAHDDDETSRENEYKKETAAICKSCEEDRTDKKQCELAYRQSLWNDLATMLNI